jgi:pimeloyl-ACP methyl ester carboxylesterase
MLGTRDKALGQGFLNLRSWSNDHLDMDVAKLLGRTCKILTSDERAVYAEPFPSSRYKVGVRRFPNLIPDQPELPGAELSRRARAWLKSGWQGQTSMPVGMKDPVLGPSIMDGLRKTIRNCSPFLEVAEAGHFVPEWGMKWHVRLLKCSSRGLPSIQSAELHFSN